MGTKLSLKIAALLLLFAFLAACGNSKQLETEKKSLQIENEALKASVHQLTDENSKFKSELDGLKAELEDLKQTDQYLFSKAKELASSNAREAKELLDKLLTRFPNSAYKVQAAAILKEVNSKLAIIDIVEKGESEINNAISSQEFNKASATLRSIKQYIPQETYSALAKKIDEEQNKPVNVTVLELLSDKSNYAYKKVIVKGYMCYNLAGAEYFDLVDGKGKCSPSVEVSYGNLPTNKKASLLTSDPVPERSHISVEVLGVFDGDKHIKAVDVSL